MVIAFGFAFFVISFKSKKELETVHGLNQENDHFQNPAKALLKIIVMILGEFEFGDLYNSSQAVMTMRLTYQQWDQPKVYRIFKKYYSSKVLVNRYHMV